ncbi:flagellar protein export ATPase FliI [Burkholderia ubonensis]|uniref:flagellar protein export ATPase FliI n=1 Tax=Burkholderia ubonensis TaxID=101571 RepID=UPI00075D758E|nr:flagellar protein export ATPase FliI [Burkholderia ubonensis]KWB79409.1 flagellar protein export ATPase FliI [Burkholderia ubonensis]
MIATTLSTLEFGDVPVARPTGRLTGVSGALLKSTGCVLETGQRCVIETAAGDWIDAEAIGFGGDEAYLMPFKKPVGLAAGARVRPLANSVELKIGTGWLGRIVNGLGEPIDGCGPLVGEYPLGAQPASVNPLRKRAVREPLDVGIRAINAALTLGKGQRVGLMAGSGVGKSVLLGMMTRYTSADVVVVGLIGERGREVREFVDESLGPKGLAKAVLVVAPADESPLMRMRAAEMCHTIAAHFRDYGYDVLLLVDSLTRYAMARREIALALGEPPATRGYPPSVFGLLPQLVETAGNGEGVGSMSAIYTVLAEGDDQQDPVVDTARAVLDGHIVLSRDLANRGHYPAIDVSRSVSRCMNRIVSREHREAAREMKELLALHEQVRDLIPLGGYVRGADPKTDRAVECHPRIEAFLRQKESECITLDSAVSAMTELM